MDSVEQAGGLGEVGVTVGDFHVHTQSILGRGGFGVVHPGKNSEGQPIAAKRIQKAPGDTLDKIRDDLDKLLKLKHPNIVTLFRILQQDRDIWVFMEFCKHGDLNQFYNGRALKTSDLIHIMLDSAAGVDFLHSQNIIHRDIKPANILLTGTSPLVAKLTDFDVCKFLEDPYDTSMMTTNVGTEAFKAPEFYEDKSKFGLRYHRNVDVYALGLTFLAMVQRHEESSPVSGRRHPLRPHIETPREESDLQENIGDLIAKRIKYGTQPQDIIPEVSAASGNVGPPGPPNQLRRLIRQMTCVKPELRLATRQIIQELRQVQEALHTAKVTHLHTFDSGLVFWEHTQFTVLPSGQHVFWGKTSPTASPRFHLFNMTDSGLQKQSEMSGLCPHEGINISPDPDLLRVSCFLCGNIQSYNTRTGEVRTAFQHPQCFPGAMSFEDRSQRRMFAVNSTRGSSAILELHQNAAASSGVLDLSQNSPVGTFGFVAAIPTNMPEHHATCHIPQHNLVAISDCYRGHIRAVSIQNKAVVWDFRREHFHPHGMVYSPKHDALLVVDTSLVVLNPSDGALRQDIPLTSGAGGQGSGLGGQGSELGDQGSGLGDQGSGLGDQGSGLGALAQPCWYKEQLVLWHYTWDNRIRISYFVL